MIDGLEPWASGWRMLYTPEEGHVGDDVFTLILDDGFDQVPAEVTLTVANQAPVAFNASATGFLGTDVLVTLTGADDDGDPLTFEIVTPPTNGSVGAPTSVSPLTAQVIYTPFSNSSPVVIRFFVPEGEHVKKGDPVLRIEDMGRVREDADFLDSLGMDRFPDPTTSGDFLRRFSREDTAALQGAILRTSVGA